MLNPKAVDFILRRKKESGNKGKQKKASKDSTFLEGVLEEKNTARKEEKINISGDRIDSTLPFT